MAELQYLVSRAPANFLTLGPLKLNFNFYAAPRYSALAQALRLELYENLTPSSACTHMSCSLSLHLADTAHTVQNV